MDPIITSVLTSFGVAFAASSFKGAAGPGQALDDIMSLVGFEKLRELAEKKREKRKLDIAAYKESIAQEIIKIDPNNLQEPQLSIVGPALEASKYYIEEEELRLMFAKLIASSMDNSKDEVIHPSFVEVIKQLSTKDAKIISYLAQYGRGNLYPIQSIQVDSKTKPVHTKMVVPVVAIFPSSPNFIENSTSVSNLERLGIIKINIDYKPIKSFEIYQTNQLLIDQCSELNELLDENQEIVIKEFSLGLTAFGGDFISCCV